MTSFFCAKNRRILGRGYKRSYREGLHYFGRGVTNVGFYGTHGRVGKILLFQKYPQFLLR